MELTFKVVLRVMLRRNTACVIFLKYILLCRLHCLYYVCPCSSNASWEGSGFGRLCDVYLTSLLRRKRTFQLSKSTRNRRLSDIWSRRRFDAYPTSLTSVCLLGRDVYSYFETKFQNEAVFHVKS